MARLGRPPRSADEKALKRLIGLNIKRMRDAHKLTQEQGAVAAGLSLSTLQKHEHGQGSTDAYWLRTWAETYGYDVNDLYTPEREGMPAPKRPRPSGDVFRLEIAPGAKVSEALIRRARQMIAALNAEAAGRTHR